MGRSAIAGWGLFSGEKVKAGQFLGEYKGEIIGNEESERRGLLYDKKGVSFLFTLNKGPSSAIYLLTCQIKLWMQLVLQINSVSSTIRERILTVTPKSVL